MNHTLTAVVNLLWLFWQNLISYCKFLMPRPLKWSIPGTHTIIIILSKNIHKVTKTNYVWFEFWWIRRYLSVAIPKIVLPFEQMIISIRFLLFLLQEALKPLCRLPLRDIRKLLSVVGEHIDREALEIEVNLVTLWSKKSNKSSRKSHSLM